MIWFKQSQEKSYGLEAMRSLVEAKFLSLG